MRSKGIRLDSPRPGGKQPTSFQFVIIHDLHRTGQGSVRRVLSNPRVEAESRGKFVIFWTSAWIVTSGSVMEEGRINSLSVLASIPCESMAARTRSMNVSVASLLLVATVSYDANKQNVSNTHISVASLVFEIFPNNKASSAPSQ